MNFFNSNSNSIDSAALSPSPALVASDGSSKPWFRFALSNAKIDTYYMGTLLFMRGDLPETTGVQQYNVTLRATDPTDGQYTDILILAQLPPPFKPSRYSLSIADLTTSLAMQQARTAGKWFVDTFPPQGFYNQGTVSGKNDVSWL